MTPQSWNVVVVRSSDNKTTTTGFDTAVEAAQWFVKYADEFGSNDHWIIEVKIERVA